MSAAAGGGAAAAAAAAMMNAVKASGAIVRVEPRDFEDLVARMGEAFVLHSPATGMFNRNHRYLTSYRGFVFFAQQTEPLFLGKGVEVLPVRKIWVPD